MWQGKQTALRFQAQAAEASSAASSSSGSSSSWPSNPALANPWGAQTVHRTPTPVSLAVRMPWVKAKAIGDYGRGRNALDVILDIMDALAQQQGDDSMKIDLVLEHSPPEIPVAGVHESLESLESLKLLCLEGEVVHLLRENFPAD